MRTRPPFTEILPGLLYIGYARKAKRLRAAGIKAIVNVAIRSYDGRRRHLPLGDGFNSARRLLAVLACLERRIQRKQVPIYLHCSAARNRSPVVAALFLVKRRRFRSFRRALRFVKLVNPQTRPTKGMLLSARAAVRLLGGKA